MQYSKILFKALLAFLIMTGPSCKKFLEVETVGRTTIPNFFSDVEGLKAGLVGSYSEMYNYYSSEFYKYPEVAGNMVDLKPTTVDMIDQFNFTSDPEQEVGAVGYIWRKILKAQANINNILQYTQPLQEAFPNRKDEIDLVKAQGLFLRALCHFDLCRVYAQPYNYTPDASHLGVPILLKTPGPDDNPSRATVKEVYDQVIKDLKEAETLFGNRQMQDAYHASLKSTQALLARVYLYSEKWDDAISYATTVINSSTLASGSNYLAMFNNLIAGEEAIFRLNGTLKTKSLGAFYSPLTPAITAADTLISLFTDTTDVRFKLFKKDPTNQAKYATLKYTILVNYNSNTERYDPMILRASEMYLIRAEANINKNNLSAAEADLKIIIGRAFDKPVADVVLNYSGAEELRMILKQERAKELSFEGHNFFDIVRVKDNLVRGVTTTSNVRFLAYPSDYFVLPIPQTELDANTNMVGNPTVNN